MYLTFPKQTLIIIKTVGKPYKQLVGQLLSVKRSVSGYKMYKNVNIQIQLNSETEINTDDKSVETTEIPHIKNKISESVDGQTNKQISVENQMNDLIFSKSGHYFPQIIELDNHTKLDQFNKNEFSNPFYLKSEDEQNITKDTNLTSKIYNSTIDDQEINSETLEDDICLSTPCPETTMCVSVGRLAFFNYI